MIATSDKVITAAHELSARLAAINGLPLHPGVVGGDPTVYCRDYYEAYLDRAASGPRRAVIVGMNPGPHGMAQTGVPFGDIASALRILGPYIERCGAKLPPPRISALCGQPGACPALLEIKGLDYHRGEESGKRLWSVLEQVCGGLDKALDRALVINYCPLVFLDDKGRNVTPATWPRGHTAVRAMQDACDVWIRAVVAAVRPGTVITVGGYADGVCRWALSGGQQHFLTAPVVSMRHPSPLAGSAQAFMSAAIPVLTQALGVDP